MHCLVVDPNVAFATLLQEELVRLGHTADVCTSGSNALSLAKSQPPDLALLDMGLEAPDALALGHQLRETQPQVRLMLIPMVGEDAALGENAPVIQGVLPKPFFLPELPDRIASALEAPLVDDGQGDPDLPDARDGAGLSKRADDRPVYPDAGAGTGAVADASDEPADASHNEDLLASLFGAEASSDSPGLASTSDASLEWLASLEPLLTDTVDAEAAPADRESPSPPVSDDLEATKGEDLRSHEVSYAEEPPARISRRAFRMNQGRIEALMRELAAELGADGVILTGDSGLLTAVGSFGEDEIESISSAVLNSSHASAEMARVLGREQLRFEQSIAGGSYLLYALGIHDAILAVTVTGDAPLGLLRHRARAAAEDIAALCV